MKLHILLITLAFSAGLALTSCSDEMDYSAPLTRFEVDGVSVTPGDESALLTWQPQADKPEPVSYLISWVSGSADGNGGSDEIGGNVTSYTVLGLTNDVAYTFSVQARYPDGLARKISVTAAPKTTRIPVGDFKAVAGDKCVFLSWTSPETSLSYTSEIVVTQNGNPVKTVECAKGESSTLVQDLTNDLEYTFTITNVYDHGRSVSLSSSAVPGHITPITCMPESPRPFEICQLEYNPAFFVQGTIASVEWKVEGVVVSKDSKITYLFTHPGVIPVTITVTFTNGQTASGTIDVEVQPFAWTEFPNAGYQKASNFAFSPDGQTLYSISQSTKVLYAIDAIAGTVKWQHTFDAATYGAGVAVGKDGKIYFGTEDKDGTLYAFMPSGTVRWTAKMGAAVKAAPAVTSDGVVYALCDGAKLKAYNADNGSEMWSADLSGNAGGVAVDERGNIYAGTSAGLWAYNSKGIRIWQSTEAHKVTERGGSLAINSKDNIIYATLKGKEGVAAVDMSDGSTKWTYKSDYNDCYHPVVDENGNVYFCEKNGALYSVSSSGVLKWKYTENLGYTYSGFAIGNNGHAYITQYASPFVVLDIAPSGSASIVSNIAQTMSPVMIGPDARLYYGLNGTIATVNIGVHAASGWSCRGANLQGTNSLK